MGASLGLGGYKHVWGFLAQRWVCVLTVAQSDQVLATLWWPSPKRVGRNCTRPPGTNNEDRIVYQSIL